MSLEDLKKISTAQKIDDSSSKRKRSYSWLLPVGLLLGFLLIFALLFGERLIPAVPVETAPVITIRSGDTKSLPTKDQSETSQDQTKGKGELLFQASGWIEPSPYAIHVPTLINGIIDQVYVLEGQAVKQGDLLATLIDEDAKLDLRTAERNYESQRKQIVAHYAGFQIIETDITSAKRKIEASATQVTNARDNFSRLNKLSAASVSKQQLVQARLAMEREMALLAEAQSKIPNFEAKKVQLSSQKEAMEAELEKLATARERAQLALDRTRIRAPMDGIILHLHTVPGMKRILNTDLPKSATIVELYDPNQLQARIDVALSEASALFVGQPVELISDLLPNQTFTGMVTGITGQADLQRNTLQVKVKIENPDSRMRPDMLVRGKFFSSSQADEHHQRISQPPSERLSLYVPERALVSSTKAWVVSPESRAELRTIKLIDTTRDGHRLVLEGLRSGESVILPPHDKLKEGSRVKSTTPKL